MLTTDECLNLGEYNFKSSPESSSNDSFMTDYADVSDEDFLQQLSCDLDIPLLLNAGEDEMSMLNSFLDISPGEILSEIKSPMENSNWPEIGKELNELQQLDLSQWGPDAFPNLKADIKPDVSNRKCSPDSKKDVALKLEDEIEVKEEFIVKSPPLSPSSSVPSPESGHSDSNASMQGFITKPVSLQHEIQIIPSNAVVPNLPTKRLIAQTVPQNKKSKIIVIPADGGKNPPNLNIGLKTTVINNNSKVVVLENVRTVPVNNMTTISPLTTVVTTQSMAKNNGSIPVQVNSMIDPKTLKRHQRMIKNRESACLSRKKKKDYLLSLEKQVQDLTTENQQLKLENSQLKDRLAAVTGQKTVNLPSKTNTVGLCAFLLIMGINLHFISNPFQRPQINTLDLSDTPKLTDHHGRSLLWSTESETYPLNNESNILPLNMCPMNVNQTESARLALELQRWIGKPYNVTNSYPISNVSSVRPLKKRARSKSYKLKNRSNYLEESTVPSVYKLNKRLRKLPSDVQNNELQVFTPTAEQLYTEFFEAINRQDDTFYVVSFSAHHMLLPALHHNKTRRPKMSLIMPSVVPNDSSSASHLSLVPLMQIDCEVLDTRLIQIKYGTIPQHLRGEGNATTHNSYQKSTNKVNTSDSDNAPYSNMYKPYFIKNSLFKSQNKTTTFNNVDDSFNKDVN